MIAQAQLENFVVNMFFLLGALIALSVLFVLAVAVWTGIKTLIFLYRRNKAEQAWDQARRRADGKPYPPFIEGVCGQCKKGNRWVYYPEDGDRGLCPACYEVFWRKKAGYDVCGFSPVNLAAPTCEAELPAIPCRRDP